MQLQTDNTNNWKENELNEMPQEIHQPGDTR
jgi:hypothetical protein